MRSTASGAVNTPAAVLPRLGLSGSRPRRPLAVPAANACIALSLLKLPVLSPFHSGTEIIRGACDKRLGAASSMGLQDPGVLPSGDGVVSGEDAELAVDGLGVGLDRVR